MAYLLYAWLRWPVIASDAGGTHRWIPALIHVFWILHAINAVLGVQALRLVASASSRQERNLINVIWPVLPWFLLFLLFLIPGVYLEFPADNWEHLRRINEWMSVQEIRQHTHWLKSGYFFAYGLVGWLAPLPWQRVACSLYVSLLSTLLCWHYFSLARALGMNRPAAWVFTALQALLLGNNLFSFYRYYGLSSTMLAQIAVVAFASRLALVASTRPPGSESLLDSPYPISWYNLRRLLPLLGLLAVMACNHLQALGMAALTMVALGGHALFSRARRWFLLLVVALAGASYALVHYWPNLDNLRPLVTTGWLNTWFGFNLAAPDSPAALRALQILGVLGALNLAAGAFLVMRNHLAGWLTIVPVVVFCFPVAALPFTALITQHDLANILVFHRLLLVIPSGCALIIAGQMLLTNRARSSPDWAFRAGFGLMVGCLSLLVITPPTEPWFNRFWNLVARYPADLSMQEVSEDLSRNLPELTGSSALYAGSSQLCFVLGAQRPVSTVYAPYYYRGYSVSRNHPEDDREYINRVLANTASRSGSILIIPRPTLLHTSISQAGYASNHWLSSECSLAFAGQKELMAASLAAGLPSLNPGDDISYLQVPTNPFNRDHSK